MEARVTHRLLDWYGEAQRDLPWRKGRDPYRIWVSEVMLQQTQVATVIPYYERFLARFPDIVSLASASIDDVLKLWEGLGYYARARNLHRAAQVVATEYQGVIPSDPKTFASLPGVGTYMTAAVQSIAFDAPLAAVDGNVKRVLARLLALGDSVDSRVGARAIRAEADRLLDRNHPGTFNQAVMELGALVCRPLNPRCDDCPLEDDCAARRLDAPLGFPIRAQKRPVPKQKIAVGVVSDGNRVLITRRAEKGMLGGLWEFPGGKVQRGEKATDACRREIREETGLSVGVDARIARVKHVYSHLEVEIDVFHCRYLGGNVVLDGPTDHRWITLDEASQYAFPKANHKFLPAVRNVLTGKMAAPSSKRRSSR
jgi:A/G-specific adenine glycosylase